MAEDWPLRHNFVRITMVDFFSATAGLQAVREPHTYSHTSMERYSVFK